MRPLVAKSISSSDEPNLVSACFEVILQTVQGKAFPENFLCSVFGSSKWEKNHLDHLLFLMPKTLYYEQVFLQCNDSVADLYTNQMAFSWILCLSLHFSWILLSRNAANPPARTEEIKWWELVWLMTNPEWCVTLLNVITTLPTSPSVQEAESPDWLNNSTRPRQLSVLIYPVLPWQHLDASGEVKRLSLQSLPPQV